MIRKLIRALGFIAAISAFLPTWEYHGGEVRSEIERDFLVRNPDAMPYRSLYSFGWQFSPLIRRDSEVQLTVDGTGQVQVQRSTRSSFGFVSWSMGALAVGVFLMWVTADGKRKPQALSLENPGFSEKAGV